MAFVAMLNYGRLRAARAYVEAAIGRARTPRSGLRRDVVDRGGRDAFLDRVPDLAPRRARSCPARCQFRNRLARTECACVSARPSPLRQGRAFRPLCRSCGFRQGLSSGLVACLSWRPSASDGPGGRVRVPGSRRRLAHASAAALTSSTWVATRVRDRLRMARVNGRSHRSNRRLQLWPAICWCRA